MKKFILAAAAWLLCAAPSFAGSCSPYPYTLINGATADANQVMADFNLVRNCAVNNLAALGANSDITSLTGLTTPLGIAYGGTGNTTGAAVSLTTARTLAITGDLVWTSPAFNGSANVTAAGTLATVNSNVGSFGSGTSSPNFTVNGKGLITAAGATTIPTLVGDSGSGGTAGFAPAPGAGTAAGNAFLKANGTWVAPAIRAYVTSLSSAPVVSGGTGVASVTRLGTGHYTINFIAAAANTNFAMLCTPSSTSGAPAGTLACMEDYNTGRTTTSVTVYVGGGTNVLQDPVALNVEIIPN